MRCLPAVPRSLRILAELLPEGCLITEERELVPFDTDAFVSYRRMPLAVVLPETTAQVAAV
jgi:glycolate oxidase